MVVRLLGDAGQSGNGHRRETQSTLEMYVHHCMLGPAVWKYQDSRLVERLEP